jgi:phosphate-selective porin OprO and OprP
MKAVNPLNKQNPMNDQLAAANGFAATGGLYGRAELVDQSQRAAMLDYLHGNVERQVSPTDFGDAAAKFDAAMRTQVAF